MKFPIKNPKLNKFYSLLVKTYPKLAQSLQAKFAKKMIVKSPNLLADFKGFLKKKLKVVRNSKEETEQKSSISAIESKIQNL